MNSSLEVHQGPRHDDDDLVLPAHLNLSEFLDPNQFQSYQNASEIVKQQNSQNRDGRDEFILQNRLSSFDQVSSPLQLQAGSSMEVQQMMQFERSISALVSPMEPLPTEQAQATMHMDLEPKRLEEMMGMSSASCSPCPYPHIGFSQRVSAPQGWRRQVVPHHPTSMTMGSPIPLKLNQCEMFNPSHSTSMHMQQLRAHFVMSATLAGGSKIPYATGKRSAPASPDSQSSSDHRNHTTDFIVRRERNREHAKRSRLRRKSMEGQLETSIRTLRIENEKLRHIVIGKLGKDRVSKLILQRNRSTNQQAKKLPQSCFNDEQGMDSLNNRPDSLVTAVKDLSQTSKQLDSESLSFLKGLQKNIRSLSGGREDSTSTPLSIVG